MPIYEYHCDRCDQTFEVIEKFSDAPLTTHEICGGAVKRLISTSALQFKGSGWYITDYAKKNGSSPTKSEGSGDSSSSKSESSAKGEGSSKSEGSSKGEGSSKSESSSESKSAPSPASTTSPNPPAHAK
jgi:putative FmdB family regulatory protein